jgi:hypothetical protein
MKAWFVASVAALFLVGSGARACAPAACDAGSPPCVSASAQTGNAFFVVPAKTAWRVGVRNTQPPAPIPPPPPPQPIEQQMRQVEALLAQRTKDVEDASAALARAKADVERLTAELVRLKKVRMRTTGRPKCDPDCSAKLDAILKRLDCIEQRLGALEEKANAPSIRPITPYGPNYPVPAVPSEPPPRSNPSH